MRASGSHTFVVLPVTSPVRSALLWVPVAALLALGPTAHPSWGQCPSPKVTGCWTHHNDSGANWGHTQIHMALLPGDGVNQHSQILSWENNVARGLHGWNPGAPTFTSYPGAPYLQDLTASLPDPLANIFCAGHATLGSDGRLLVAGGHDGANNVGIAARGSSIP